MNSKLILRTLTSPFATPYTDQTKGSVLSWDDVDNNFIYLKGQSIYSGNTSGANLILNQLNGDSVTINLAALTTADVTITGVTYTNNTFTFINNTGGTFNVLFNTLTGLTVNGRISVTTISSTTVGIGVLPTLGKLHIKGSTSANTTNALYVENSGGTNTFAVNDAGYITIGSQNITLTIKPDDLNTLTQFSSTNDGYEFISRIGEMRFNRTVTGPMLFYPNQNVTRMDFAGNSGGSVLLSLVPTGAVGINQTSPQELLHINGNLRINDSGTTYGQGKILVSDANGTITFSSTTQLNLFTGTTISATSITARTQFSQTAYTNILSATTISGNSILTTAGTIYLSNKTVQTLTQSGGTLTWNVTNGQNAIITATTNTTAFTMNNLVAGEYYTIEYIQGGSGSYTLALPTSPISKVVDGGGGAVTLTTSVGSKDILTAYYNGTTLNWTYGKNFT